MKTEEEIGKINKEKSESLSGDTYVEQSSGTRESDRSKYFSSPSIG